MTFLPESSRLSRSEDRRDDIRASLCVHIYLPLVIVHVEVSLSSLETWPFAIRALHCTTSAKSGRSLVLATLCQL